MNVLMFTRRVDKDDWLAGFAHRWVDALGRHPKVGRLHVVCLEMGTYDLPGNVTVQSMGKEHGYSRLRELRELWRAVSDVISDVDVVFGHMIPRYVLAASPLILPRRIPIVQWYTHRQVTLELRLVHAIAAHMVTASAESFRLPSNKLTVLGHGIDMQQFSPGSVESAKKRILAVGRLSPIKHYETLIEATSLLVQQPEFADLRVEIAGGLTPQQGEDYAESLYQLVRTHSLEDNITFLGPVPHHQIPELLHNTTVSVNLCPTGGVDKAVIESMASAVPVVVRNETFVPLLSNHKRDLWCPVLDSACVAEKLAHVLSLPDESRTHMGMGLRERVEEEYALDGLIERLVSVFEGVINCPASPNT